MAGKLCFFPIFENGHIKLTWFKTFQHFCIFALGFLEARSSFFMLLLSPKTALYKGPIKHAENFFWIFYFLSFSSSLRSKGSSKELFERNKYFHFPGVLLRNFVVGEEIFIVRENLFCTTITIIHKIFETNTLVFMWNSALR